MTKRSKLLSSPSELLDSHPLIRSSTMLISGLSGNEIYCLAQKGWAPGAIVVGNSVYSLGFVRGLTSGFQTLAGGELTSVTELISDGRHAALQRMEEEARQRGASAVVDILTHIVPFGPGVKEMLMIGTASHHPTLGNPSRPITSELTGEELWNLAKIGYAPLRLVLGTSVYALGFGGGIATFFKSFTRGEVNAVTRLIYEAREHALEHLRADAEAAGADAVVGVK